MILKTRRLSGRAKGKQISIFDSRWLGSIASCLVHPETTLSSPVLRDLKGMSSVPEVNFRLALNKKLDVLWASDRVEGLLGYRLEDLLAGTSLAELIHPNDAEIAGRLVSAEGEDGGGEVNLRFRHADGAIRCMRGHFKREFMPDGQPVLNLEVSDAKCLHRVSGEHRPALDLISIFDSLDECVCFKDPNHVIVWANRNYRHMFSQPDTELRELVGLTDYDLLPENIADEFYELEKQALASKSVIHVVHETVNAGKREWLDSRIFLARDEKEQIIGLFSILSVITEGVLAEQALRESENSLKEAQRIAGLGSYMMDLVSGVWTSSDALDEVLGIDKNYAHTVEGWTALMHPDDSDMMSAHLANKVQHRATQFSIEYRIVRPLDHAVRWVHGLGRLEFDAQGRPTLLRGTCQDITARKQAEADLQQSQNILKLFIEHAPAALAMFDREMRYLAVSRRFLLDYALLEQEVIGRCHYDVFPEIPERWKKAHRRGLAGENLRMEEDRLERADGRVQWVRWELIPWRTHQGDIGGIILSTEDITAVKASEDRLHQAASVFTHASEGIIITDPRGAILDVNDAFTRITGYTRTEVLGRNPRLLNSGRQNREFYTDMWRQLKESGKWQGEIWNRAKSGQTFAEMLTINAVPDSAGKTKQYVAMFSDITSMKEQELQLERIAHYDLLTGLPNRVLLADRVNQAMAQAHRRGRLVAIACLDMDSFRAINDQHGHTMGDQLLTVITRRMNSEMREGDTLARLGGDEFVAVMIEIASIEDSIPLITRLLEAAAKPAQLGELTLQVSASVGVTYYPQAEDVDAEQLLRQADQAMYHAKVTAKGGYHIFDPTLDRSLRGHHEDLQRVRAALEGNEFVLHYQPRVNMCTGAILSAEVLLRWQHPERGLLSPGQFLPIVLGNPLIVEMGEWVIRGALAQIELWREQGFNIPVSVNLDAQQLQQAGFVQRLTDLLAEHSSVSPSRLELEVLESSALQDMTQVSQVIRACSKLGVTFALDDFGTGYSSLSYLKRLPVQVLKIDQTFVHDMLDNPEDLTILEGILGLANAFRRQAVAEGVETVEHGLMLLRLGCQVGQGYGIAYPMPGDNMPAWATNWRPDPRWINVSPIDPLNWPLLYASVEHRAWIASIEAFLSGRRHAPPPMDHHRCRFGSWLDAEAAAGRGTRPGFQALDALHQRTHAFANGILDLKADGEGKVASAASVELHALRDGLLEKLQYFVQAL